MAWFFHVFLQLTVKSQNKIALIKEFRRGNTMLTLNQYTALKIQRCFYWSLQGPLYKYSTTVLPRPSNAVKKDTYSYRKKEEPSPSFISIEDSIYNWIHARSSLSVKYGERCSYSFNSVTVFCLTELKTDPLKHPP